MAEDKNKNGVPDDKEVTFHIKSAIAGAVLALALGGSLIGLARAVFPDSDTVHAIGTWFAGGTCGELEDICDQEKKELVDSCQVDKDAMLVSYTALQSVLVKAEKVVVCCMTSATIYGYDNDSCKRMLNE